MQKADLTPRSWLTVCILIMAASVLVGAQAQAPATQFEPQVGQQGKDVVWVPTPQILVDKMLDMAKVTARTSSWILVLGTDER